MAAHSYFSVASRFYGEGYFLSMRIHIERDFESCSFRSHFLDIPLQLLRSFKSQYKDFDKFLATYEVPSSLIDGIIAEGKKEKIEPKDEAELIQTKKYLALQLKALVARDIWDMSQYFQVWNETNEIVLRAVQLLTTGK